MVNVNISIFLRALDSRLEVTAYGSGGDGGNSKETSHPESPTSPLHTKVGDGGTADPGEPLPALHTITLNVGDGGGGGGGSNPDPPSEKS